jgi:hypothetical protein
MRNNQSRRLKPLTLLSAVLVAAALGTPASLKAEKLTKQTEEAFARHVRAAETQMDRELADGKFLSIDALPPANRDQAYTDLKNGQILIRPTQSNDSTSAASLVGGLIHDWTGIVLIPGVSMSQVIAVVQDYEHASQYYGPDVVKSRLLERSGNDFRVLLRLKQVHIVTVVLDSEYSVHYTFPDATHALSRSYSTRIAEVENAGEAQERDMPVGDDDGFLWRLYSYWRFYQSPEGVFVQCTAISLTRNVPAGFGWLVRPFLETIPRDSLRFTLEATRNALAKQVQTGLHKNSSCTGGKAHEHKAKFV